MTVNFSSSVKAGTIAEYTNDGYSLDINLSNPSFGFPHVSESPLETLGLAPLTGYTHNVGGAGFYDPPQNILDAERELFSFVNVPASASTYATIFTTSITLTNVSNNTLELFPSGIFVNPPTDTQSGETSLHPELFSDPFGPIPLSLDSPSFLPGGEIYLHTEAHDYQVCTGLGFGSFQGATITGVPEPSSLMLSAASAILLLTRRKRS